MQSKWNELCNAAASFRERNDCAVRAVSVVAGIGYAEAHAALRAEGRRNGQGTYFAQYKQALEKMGFEVKPFVLFFSRTTKTLVRNGELPKGRKFLVISTRHVGGWDGEQYVDWAVDRAKRLRSVWEVIKKEPKPEPAPAPAPAPEPKPKVVNLQVGVATRKNPTGDVASYWSVFTDGLSTNTLPTYFEAVRAMERAYYKWTRKGYTVTGVDVRPADRKYVGSPLRRK